MEFLGERHKLLLDFLFNGKKTLDIMKDNYFEKNFWKKSHSTTYPPEVRGSNLTESGLNFLFRYTIKKFSMKD